jgi:hypothetical protein
VDGTVDMRIFSRRQPAHPRPSMQSNPITHEQLERRGKLEFHEPGGSWPENLEYDSYTWGQSDQAALLAFLQGAGARGGWLAVGAARNLFDALPDVKSGSQFDAINGSAIDFLRSRPTPLITVPPYLANWWRANSNGQEWDPDGLVVVGPREEDLAPTIAPQRSPGTGSTAWLSQLPPEEAVNVVSRLFRELPPNRDIVPLESSSVVGARSEPHLAYLAHVFGTPIAVFPPPSVDDAVVFTFDPDEGGTRIGALLYGQCHPGTAFDLRTKLGQLDPTIN